MRLGIRTLCLAAAIGLAPFPSWGQEPAEDEVRLEANEVLLDVVVTDDKGRPVQDLRPDEIEIYENGERQSLTSLTLVRDGGASAMGGDVPKQIAESPVREVNLVMLLFDRTKLSNQHLHFVKKGAREFVETRLRPNDLVAILAIGARPYLIQNFTSDKTALLEAIERSARAGSSFEATFEGFAAAGATTGDPGTSGSLAGISTTFGNDSLLENVFNTSGIGLVDSTLPLDNPGQAAMAETIAKVSGSRLFKSLFAVVRAYSRLPGRKAVVLYSGTFSDTEAQAVGSLLDRLTSFANRHNITFYTAGGRGLDAGPGAAAKGVAVGNYIPPSPLTYSGGDAVLGRLAASTGGKFTFNSNDLGKSLDTVVEDLRSYYLASYAPTNDAIDGSYRAIRVKVMRKGVSVRARKGYHATPSQAPWLESEAPILRALGDALTGTPRAEVPIAVASPHFRVKDGAWYVPVLVGLAGDGLTPEGTTDGGKHAFRVDSIVTVRDATQEVVSEFSRQTRLTVEADRVEAFRSRTTLLPPLSKPVVLAPGRYTITYAFYEPSSGKATVLERAIEVPATKDAQIATSGLVLCRAAEPADAAPMPEKVEPFLLPSKLRLTPSPGARFDRAAGDRLIPLLRVYGKPKSSVRIGLKVLHASDGRAVIEMPSTPIEADANGEAIFARAFAIGALAPGEYVVEATVTAVKAQPIVSSEKMTIVDSGP